MRKLIIYTMFISLLITCFSQEINGQTLQSSEAVPNILKIPMLVYPYVESPVNEIRTYAVNSKYKFLEDEEMPAAIIGEGNEVWYVSESMNEVGLTFQYRILDRSIHVNLESEEMRLYAIEYPFATASYLNAKYLELGYDYWQTERSEYSIYDLGFEIAGHAILVQGIEKKESDEVVKADESSEELNKFKDFLVIQAIIADCAFGREDDAEVMIEIAKDYYIENYTDPNYPYQN